MADKIPEALGSVIQSRLSGMTLVKMRAGWSNFNQSVNHDTPRDPENWDVLYDNSAESRRTVNTTEDPGDNYTGPTYPEYED